MNLLFNNAVNGSRYVLFEMLLIIYGQVIINDVPSSFCFEARN